MPFNFAIQGRTECRIPLSPHIRIKLGPYLLRSRTTLPGPLASGFVEAALLGLLASSGGSSSVIASTGTCATSLTSETPSVGGGAQISPTGESGIDRPRLAADGAENLPLGRQLGALSDTSLMSIVEPVASIENASSAVGSPVEVQLGTTPSATVTAPSSVASSSGLLFNSQIAGGEAQRFAAASVMQQMRLAEHGLELLTHQINK
ncbi:unnamed protein product [Protopolystoma xenopodis]|uniref:Uncharacterized protein n=1 Tax=Protopolystoma xenopodis TaxID=117903 RepID=A0A3S5AJH5_9PLAT|nr:unnamed protein product [Protopolystoma xenopodis]